MESLHRILVFLFHLGKLDSFKEIEEGIIPDPNAIDPITGEPLPTEGGDIGAMGDVPMEPEIDGGITDAEMQKDTKKAEI